MVVSTKCSKPVIPNSALMALMPSTIDHQEAAGIILEEAMRMKELVDGILTMSKLDGGRVELNCREMDLAGFIRDELTSLKGMEVAEQIQFQMQEGPEPVMALADRELLERAFRNVIDRQSARQPQGRAGEPGICAGQPGARAEDSARQRLGVRQAVGKVKRRRGGAVCEKLRPVVWNGGTEWYVKSSARLYGMAGRMGNETCGRIYAGITRWLELVYESAHKNNQVGETDI